MRRKPSAFTVWFRAQFGSRPSPSKSLSDLKAACGATDRAHWHAVLALREREDYEARETAALYAWRAKGGK